jgi:hypothetical protein
MVTRVDERGGLNKKERRLYEGLRAKREEERLMEVGAVVSGWDQCNWLTYSFQVPSFCSIEDILLLLVRVDTPLHELSVGVFLRLVARLSRDLPV